MIRNEDDFIHHVDYIHINPIKHKLVAKPKDWPWSSYKEFLKRGYYEKGWGLAKDIFPAIKEG